MRYVFFSAFHARRIQLFLTLFLILLGSTGCSFFGNPIGKPVSQSRVMLTSTPSIIRLGTQPCPTSVNTADAWKNVAPLAANQRIEHVLCGNLLGIPTLQAVVMVRHAGSDAVLDIFVYSTSVPAHATSIFALKGLIHGDAKISNYNTLLTAQEDQNSLYNKGLTNQWTADLSREYKWSNAAGTLVQVPFSGIFPDVTRYQAEFEQSQVNNAQGFQQWRLSAITTTQHFCENLLKWPSDTPVTVLSGGGVRDIHAVVQVKQPSSSLITIKLDRLEYNANGGLWEVIDAQTEPFALTIPQSEQAVTSPIRVTGHGGRGTIGSVQVLDHLYSQSGESQVWGASDTGNIAFSTSVSYTLSFQGGTQEGVVALFITRASDHVVTGMAVTKTLLSA